MNKILLCILDGVGISNNPSGNAFLNAEKPNFDYLFNNFPHCSLEASGKKVGLPDGQMGNSEVGHMNIGAGRIVYQSLEYINKRIEDKSFFSNEKLLNTINHTKKYNSNLHIMGLLSDGGIHSHINHLEAIISLLKEKQATNVYYHFFLDGRDTSPYAGEKYLQQIVNKINEANIGSIASISGRYYAMDRDNRFERIQKVYNMLVLGDSLKFDNPFVAWQYNQGNEITDEFTEPCLINEKGLIRENDGIICFNFRPDRIKELFATLTNPNYKHLEMSDIKNLSFTSMMPISDEIIGNYAFQLPKINNTLGEVLEKNNLSQLRIAETEKYPHVTYFFDGGEEKKLNKCNRVLVPSSKVATYDLKPEMSAHEITDKLLSFLLDKTYDVIILNFANGDMVGHTGNYEAAKLAVEQLDICLGKIINNLNDYTLILTADHGNCEEMLDKDDKMNTKHTTNLVPFIITKKDILLKNGKLADIAPTILNLLNLDIPKEMEGNGLVINEKKEL